MKLTVTGLCPEMYFVWLKKIMQVLGSNALVLVTLLHKGISHLSCPLLVHLRNGWNFDVELSNCET